MRRLADAGPDQWRAALRGRNQVLTCQAHPAAIPRLLGRAGVLPAGRAELPGRGFDLVAGLREVDQFYSNSVLWPDIARDLAIRTAGPDSPGVMPNLTMFLPKIPWPFGDRAAVPDSVLAADLIDSSEPREVRAGAQRLAELLEESLP
jgi:hypothetical protein